MKQFDLKVARFKMTQRVIALHNVRWKWLEQRLFDFLNSLRLVLLAQCSFECLLELDILGHVLAAGFVHLLTL